MKTKIIKLSLSLLAYCLCLTVMLASVHAKDLVSYGKLSLIGGVAALSLTDVGAKALSNLHNHVDNTSFNHFIQVVHRRQVERERELERDEALQNSQTIIDRLLSRWRLFRASFGLVLSFKNV
ncbi:MAG TPA: hypothetical protein VFL81_00630 [Candidatus Saccharimonadales bacterium]|nr:hypothetical protein [Candidatus Saccharimonadales bacterium]